MSNEDMETLIPSLTLQMLLENAVKHNALRKSSPLRIEILIGWGILLSGIISRQKVNNLSFPPRLGYKICIQVSTDQQI
jgi:hypothetical protein